MQTEYTRRLYDRLRQGEVTYATLEEIHLKLYSAAKEHYEALLGVEVDGSGKDISRGYFMSFDPHAYINAALLEQISPLPARIIPPAKKENSPKKTPVETVHPLPASSAATPQDAKPWEKLIFSCRDRREAHHQVPGRQPRQLPLRPGQQMLQQGPGRADSHQTGEKRVRTRVSRRGISLHNAYIYTDKTSEAATKKEEKKPVINQVMSFLEEHYGIRRNLILDRLEFMPYALSADAGKGYRPMRGKDYNTIFVDLQMAGISCYQNFLRAVIDSNYAKEFNPTPTICTRFPLGRTDYIAQLADTLTTENRELWQEGFKRWIVGLVDCALSDEDMNQLVIILYSEQGKERAAGFGACCRPSGKSTSTTA